MDKVVMRSCATGTAPLLRSCLNAWSHGGGMERMVGLLRKGVEC